MNGLLTRYFLQSVFHCDQYTLQDSLAFQARQVGVYQMESFIAPDSSSSVSSTSSKVDMGGPGKLEIAAWLSSPSFGVVEGTEAKVTLSIRNFTKKKVCNIFDTEWQPSGGNSSFHHRRKGSNLNCFE
jgi:hypothetical protein